MDTLPAGYGMRHTRPDLRGKLHGIGARDYMTCPLRDKTRVYRASCCPVRFQFRVAQRTYMRADFPILYLYPFFLCFQASDHRGIFTCFLNVVTGMRIRHVSKQHAFLHSL
jgi:hypothetical protein